MGPTSPVALIHAPVEVKVTALQENNAAMSSATSRGVTEKLSLAWLAKEEKFESVDEGKGRVQPCFIAAFARVIVCSALFGTDAKCKKT